MVIWLKAELCYNALCCYEQILEGTLHKTTAVWPLTTHLQTYLRQRRHAGHRWRNKDEH